MRRTLTLLVGLGAAGAALAIGNSNRDKPPTTAQVMESAQPTDWRRPDPENTLYLELPAGRVIIELAPRFAPAHVANIKALARDKFFDGLPVARVQDNFVAQWGDADKQRPTEAAARKLADETIIPWNKSLPIVKLPDTDGYAPETGWLDGFPVGIERKPSGQVWMTHCYGVLGVGRDNWPDNGSGAELYVVIGQAPRQLDRNIVVAGRVLRGIELLSSLPRGTAELGYYEKPEQRTLITRARVAADVPESERTALEVLRTDTPLFTKYVEARRNRRDDWYLVPAGHTDVCSISVPVR
ncbi:MAG TPA: peptidylprolyl isomerase [Steroidobacteraceae bacterium]|jgi:peptidylprolyl isomerase|nr:peptidylprolyl isomerase [Steroidobacteraceae bacterium]